MKMSRDFNFLALAGVVTAVKILLIPTYRSTDFEVHRNWLAITHSLPIKRWYYENTSEWTLDYPPLFAWFEHILSWFALLFDRKMLIINNLNYASPSTVLFQRLSVIVTDFVYIYAAKEFCKGCIHPQGKASTHFFQQKITLAILLTANCGLYIVDHIHFQYNGFLFGLLLLSVARIHQRRNVEASLLFATLLNFKHIFLYIAPAYIIYLLRNYCFTKANKDGSVMYKSFNLLRLLTLGVIVSSVFIMSFGPFISMGQLTQVLSRLFPFKRGLCHAYWAPNCWALYTFADKVATFIGQKLGQLPPENLPEASMTGGLVQEFDHVVFPSIKPVTTLICTVLSILPALFHLWRWPTGPRGFLRCLVLCAYGSFMFGWHVHEKAVLLIIIPLSLLAIEKKNDAQVYLLLCACGHVSLFPLIFTHKEMILKYCLVVAFTIFSFMALHKLFAEKRQTFCLPLLSKLETLYVMGLIPLEVYVQFIHPGMGLQERLPFLPLLLTSTYCALGVVYSWIKFYIIALKDTNVKVIKMQ